MTVTAVRKDPRTLTMTLEAEFDASPERVWQLWADPRQLERWWGPPTYPATFTRHDLAPGSRVEYYMTGPEGDQPHGDFEGRDAIVGDIVKMTILNRAATLEDVGNVAAFVASDKARSMTAATANVSCGALID
jgi:uncharacterized protein YndB with AHSA1/START domain